MSDKYYGMLIAELEAHLEDRERTIGAQTSELVAYERWVNEYDATIGAQHDTIERLNVQLAAALATIEAAAQPPEWATATVETYIAVEDPESGEWGVEDSLGGILYDAEDMNQAQAEALANAHSAGVQGFVAVLEWLEERGIDFVTLGDATGADCAEGCAP